MFLGVVIGIILSSWITGDIDTLWAIGSGIGVVLMLLRSFFGLSEDEQEEKYRKE